jgi:hypothetical protein
MAQWSDDVPDEARQQWDRLLTDALRLVRRVMRRTGRLAPFAFTVNAGGTVGQTPMVHSDDIEWIYEFLRPGAAGLSSVLVAANAALHGGRPGQRDCVAFFFEYRNGASATRLMPYRRVSVPFCRALFGEVIAIPTVPPHRVWPVH